MGFSHCPICVVLAFIYLLIGVSRSYMFLILLREIIGEESKLELKFRPT